MTGNDNPADQPRKGEEGPVPSRRSRTYYHEGNGQTGDSQQQAGWYFMTREQTVIGPFATQDLAEIAVRDYAGFAIDADELGE